MNRISNVLLGTDIELFLQNKNTHEIVSAEGIIKGTKHKPFNFDPSNRYYATSLDNVLAEFCAPPAPPDRVDLFIAGIEKSLNFIKSTLPPELNVLHVASAYLDDKWLQTKNAKLFGCESDFCAWTRSTNEKPSADKNLRSSGFHVHVGYDNPDQMVTEDIIKTMDLYLGVPSVLIDPDTERRKLYGKAGAFRFKEYGCEYRTLSGYFLSSKELAKWVFNNTISAIKFVDGYNQLTDELGNDIQQAINTNDKALAQQIVNDFNIVMP